MTTGTPKLDWIPNHTLGKTPAREKLYLLACQGKNGTTFYTTGMHNGFTWLLIDAFRSPKEYFSMSTLPILAYAEFNLWA